MRLSELFLLSGMVLSLSACGGSDSTPADTGTGGNGSGTQTLYGAMNVYIDSAVTMDAVFFSTNQQVPQAALDSGFRSQPDTCDVYTVDNQPTPGNLDANQLTTVSAGEVITVSSPAGSYLELAGEELFGRTFYEQAENVTLAAPAPSGLTVSLPGDAFPAFTNVAIPAVEPLQMTTPSDGNDQIDADTTFTWTAGSDANAYINISTGTEDTFIDCYAVDDGSFNFTENARTALAGTTQFATISRESHTFQRQGNAIFSITVTAER